MSGGVDSSVAAARLVREGYDVIGVTMRLSEEVRGGERAAEDARGVAELLQIPHYVADFRELFRRRVIDYFVTAYAAGQTPNPCVACNHYLKFSGLWEKAQEFGAKVVTCSDSNGYIYDPDGIDLAALKDIKEVRRARIKEYAATHPHAEYHEGCTGVWSVKCDIALPCATQGEIDLESAKLLVANGVQAVGEGANMPSTLDAIAYFQSHKVLFAPAKAANAGGVATSALEMSQNSERRQWTFEKVDKRLRKIMSHIYRDAKKNAELYADPDDLVAGANITAFVKVADVMLAHGLV